MVSQEDIKIFAELVSQKEKGRTWENTTTVKNDEALEIS